jgi:hypothetical protein
MMLTIILYASVFYVGNLALSFVLWTCHSLAWFHWCMEPCTTQAEANDRLYSDRVNRLLRRWFFALLTPLIWLYEAHDCTQTLLRITLLQRSGYPVEMVNGKVLLDLRKKSE